MFKLNKMRIRAGLLVLAAMAVILPGFFAPTQVLAAATTPSLGAAGSFSVLAAKSMSAAGTGTTITGDLGLSPGLAVSRTGLWHMGLGSTEYFGTTSLSAAAQTDALGAFTDLAGRSSSGNWGTNPWSPAPGVWTVAADTTFTGTVTLNGTSNDLWVFQVGGDMTFSGSVVLAGTAQACHVFWQIGRDATIASGSAFVGTLIASRDITLVSGATVNGRIISLFGALTTDGNTITTGPVCASGAHLSLAKLVSPASYGNIGDVLNYTLVATNDGNANLDVSISDLDPGFIITGSTPPLGSTLIPGATMTVTGTHIITQADLANGSFKNTANASGSTEVAIGVVSVNATRETFRATSVGGEVSAINKTGVLAPWLGLGLVLVLGGTLLTVLLLRRRTSR